MKSQTNTRFTVLVYYAVFIFMGMVIASTGPLLPALTEKYQVSLSQISLIFPANSLGYILSSFFGGRLYDHFKGHRILLLALLLCVVMIVLIPAIASFWMVLAIYFILGLSTGGMDVGCNTLLVWKLREKAGPFMNGLHFFFGVGSFLVPLLISRAAIILGQPIRSYWFMAFAALPAALLLIRLPGPVMPPPPAMQTQTKTRANSLLILVLTFFFFLHVGAQICFGNWIYTYTLTTSSGSANMAAYLNSAFWAAITVGRLLAIPVTMRVKTSSLLLGSLIGSVASILVVLIWPASPAALWISTIGVGLSLATLYPSTLTYIGESMTLSGRITGYLFVGGSLGGMILPWLIGQLFEPVGPLSAMVIPAAALLAALLVFVFLLRYLRQQTVKSSGQAG